MKNSNHTTAIVERPGQKPRYLPGAVNYKGYLCTLFEEGVGESWTEGGFSAAGDGETWEVYEKYVTKMKPYFDGDLVPDDARESYKKYKTVEDVFADGKESQLMKWGEHENYSVRDYEEVKREKEAEKQSEFHSGNKAINFVPSYFGLCLANDVRLPRDIWNKIKHLAEYHSGSEDEQEFLDDQGYFGIRKAEIKGWYFKNEVIDTLVKAGFKVTYCREEVQSESDILFVNKKINEAEKEEIEKSKTINRDFNDLIYTLTAHKNVCTEEEAEYAKSLEKMAHAVFG